MKYVQWLIILTAGMLLLMGCSEDSSTGPDNNEVILIINEFMASNDFGPVDEHGDHDDWIEIYNAGNGSVDIGGMYVTDNLEELMTSQIPATNSSLTTIEPGEYLVLWADKEPEQGILHLDDVKLSSDGEDIGLIDVDGVTILDSYTYEAQTTDASMGRLPDGGDTWTFFGEDYTSMPTPGASNGTGGAPMVSFIINEFMASNDYTYADENGDFDDWIEIYNAGNIPGNIGGMYITDDLEELDTWQIPDSLPDLTLIPPGGYLILWADKESEQGVLHVEIKLSGDGEAIGLTAADGVTVVDQFTYDAQTTDVSMGRLPDGSDTWAFFGDGYDTIPTPGAENGSGAAPEAILMINEFLASNDSCYADENGDYDDWIEIYNAGNATIDIGGLYITDDLEELNTWQIPDNDPELTTIPPRQFLILWADKEPEQGALHVDIKLSGDGEAIGLVESDAITIIDSYTFGPQTTDVSEGRLPDGSDNWVNFDVPTPGASNQ